MNLPNKLTMLRIILVPFFVLFMSIGATATNLFIALVIFVVASLTDMLDGKIARKYGLVTNFGKLMDPLADKVLVMSAMLCFVSAGLAPAWIVIVILTREFLVTSLRLIAAGEGTVIAADKWGKIKTVTQMLWIIWTILWIFIINLGVFNDSPEMGATLFGWLLSDILMYASTFFTLLSGFNYVYKNRQLLFSDM
ncbi:MAG: CDP-diacylglycerol--glycerol-3-phosphate 3-phosphatidyltransferase [Oscillospiraceae bacterium]|nr:CDP-diacylglycerol--glycerol-3-phosphate 3-phosphatidyltransferase [Oscillospiraceae bacterium]